jgi:hypothetical protein
MKEVQMLDFTTKDHVAYLAALADAMRRAAHSYYDQHVLRDDEKLYIAIDEGDYAWIPEWLIERIVHTVPGERIDEY